MSKYSTELINTVRDRLYDVLRKLEGNEKLTEHDIARKYAYGLNVENGIKNQKRIIEELVPFLKEHNFDYANPTVFGIIYINCGFTSISIKSEDTLYDIEMYRGLSRYCDAGIGYNPNKKLNLESLKEELLLLKDYLLILK